jgi:hypothetical protein
MYWHYYLSSLIPELKNLYPIVVVLWLPIVLIRFTGLRYSELVSIFNKKIEKIKSTPDQIPYVWQFNDTNLKNLTHGKQYTPPGALYLSKLFII